MIGIICGGGDYPRLIAEACVKKNLSFCLVFLNGFCSPDNWPTSVNSISINFGEIQKVIDFLKRNKVKKIIFAGKVKRPNFDQLSLDKKGKSWLIKLGKAIFAGDDTLLRAVTALIQQEGFEIISGTNLLDDVFLKEGIFSQRKPSKSDYNDINIGIDAAKDLGISDVGQSVIVRNGNILDREDSDGTDALIKRCAAQFGKRGGILVKISKPQQDDRLDLPTIGIETIEMLHKNGFDGVAIEANRCIVIDKENVIKRANDFGMFLVSVNIFSAKIFIIAGEASGDYLGGELMKNISQISGRKIEFFGIGGPCMEKAGLKKLFSINELSIIGIAEVIVKIMHVKRLIDKTVKSVCDYHPDVVVTIDSSGFTHRVAKRVKKIGGGSNNSSNNVISSIPLIHYVAPPVWAWRRWRAKSMHKFIDKLMTLFPFEPAYFKGLKTVFVGHPIATDSDFDKPSEVKIQNFLNSICKIKDRSDYIIITLLPGSRMSEIIRHLPILEAFTNMMAEKYKKVKFFIPTVQNLESKINELTQNWSQKPIITTFKSQKVLSYYSSDAAVAASGTVTLELARVGLPFIAIYKTSSITYWIVKTLIKVKNVCLVNLLAKKDIVPELLQKDCTAQNIFDSVQKIITHPKEREAQKKVFRKIIKIIGADPQKAAKEVLVSVKSFGTSFLDNDNT